MTTPDGAAGLPADELPAEVEARAGEILLGPPERIGARFAELCSAHPAQRPALERVRRDFERAAAMLALGPSPAAVQPASAPVPAQIGPYRILRQIGAGAFGIVYLAEQDAPIRRQLALKVLHASSGSAGARDRFLHERATLARMNHPAIARIFDAGVDAHERPYFAMEHVPGEPLDRFAAARGAGLEQRLDLFLAVCEGVNHAHQRGVIHRDLKPHNILVAEVDGRWLPKVIDFGLAKVLEADGDAAVRTHAGAVLGTPAYMSPEQVNGETHAIDTRTDVYALGVILYQLLTGSLPFAGPHEDQGFVALQRRILEQEPPLVGAAAERAGVPFARRLRGDLDWIVRKAMAKAKDERYATVVELAADLRRFQHHEPVIAGPPSTSYVVRKFVRRHRGAMTAGALVFASLLLGLTSSLSLYRTAQQNAARAQAHLVDFWRLADIVELEQLEAEAAQLWPSLPERLAEHERWLERARAVAARSRGHAAALAALRAQAAGPAGTAATAVDAAAAERFLLDRLQQHIDRVTAFASATGTLAAVARRAEFARTVQARTLDERRADWDQAIARVAANARYGGLRLRPQVGLVPLGLDPDSGFEEFAHLQSGAVPTRGADGHLAIGDDSAIVLVLVPGGTWTLGSQSTDPRGIGYDPFRTAIEKNLETGTMGPFLLGKYELTQGQVRTLGMPSHALDAIGTEQPDHPPVTARHPEESVLGPEMQAWLPRFGLRLPDTLEWEVAARAGSSRIWGLGDRPEDLQDHANVADASLVETAEAAGGAQGIEADPCVRDGYAGHAPVGSYRANAFGFHDMLGNVSELVTATYALDTHVVLSRGGSYRVRPIECRVGSTRLVMASQSTPELGLRVARDVPHD